jgi:hypothetical protein
MIFFKQFLITVYIVAWTPVEIDISSDGREYQDCGLLGCAAVPAVWWYQ